MEEASDINAHLARRLRGLRVEQGLTLDALADRTGVSRSMISLIERGESSPTAVVLDKIAAGLGVTLASLFAEQDSPEASPLSRFSEQRIWRDPDSGYVRRNLSPPGFPSPLELVEVVMPAGARVAYDTGRRSVGVSQQIWIVEGEIEIGLGEKTFRLFAGDCLCMDIEQPTIFRNLSGEPARYLVALATDAALSNRRGGSHE
ncbi:helix-turn-helix domain-containing protein [Microvirga solisilvae]|uniref:helix-turn-helix domain-containing protein n=1 Tax=Microvirga solisilvae TaxID=2919498 RepID=UPI001FAEAF69|nr:XRE family transcriptional regulator [Microvirga solisilvae]